MRKRRFTLRAVHWLLLAACVLLFVALGRLFWSDASDGRDAREAERAGSAQQQAQDAAPASIPPPAE